MDSPGSDMSSDSSDTSIADSASDKSSPVQTIQPTSEPQLVSTNVMTKVGDDDDSDSDVSMSADSEDDEDGTLNKSAIQVNPINESSDPSTPLVTADSTVEASRKRRLSNSTETPGDQLRNGMPDGDRKRLRADEEHKIQPVPNGNLPKDRSFLPSEIWHHIFTFCPPRVLGVLLQVNKSFHAHIDPSSSNNSVVALPKSIVKMLKSDDIWRASRKHFLPGAPGPLLGKSELDMWKLACGSLCQFCSKKNQVDPKLATDQWHPGPGENGVVPIWSFGIRTCGSCLKEQSIKEIDLLLSSSVPSPLMAALSFVFFTNELHVIPPAILQNSHHPQSIQITKHFANQRVEDIKKEFEGVTTLGSATAEEWLKGLDSLGKERRNDAARWERWEGSGGLAKMRSFVSHVSPKLAGHVHNSLPTKLRDTSSSYQPHHASKLNPQSAQFPTNQAPPMALQVQNNFLPNAPPRFDSPSQNGFAHYPPRSYAQPKHERTKEEVAELKATRRAEIERRCMLLDPPLTAGVLAHMASFQAAIQIIQPLSDGAWEVLKPRLLSQREEAEQRENDRLAQTRVVQERFDNRYQDTHARSDSKDLVDREWEDIQAPLRARIGGYADEIIRDGWNGGEKVTSENCPLFAAEVLIYVRKRFYAEVAKDEAAVRATGREPESDPPNGPYTRKLILENMKWIFDTKVKPHTEPYRKELFLCNACEFITKYYGFEGVIQHYAAKHTSALSQGSIVVHWKSEWPEYPPFNPDPTSVKPYFSTAPSASLPYTSSAPPPMQQNYGYGGYQPVPVSAPMQMPNLHVYQESPGPYYGHPQFDQYSGHQNGPYAPPSQFPDVSQGYQAPQYSAAPPQGSIPGYDDTSMDYSQQGFGGPHPVSTQDIYTPSHQGQIYPASLLEVPQQQPDYGPQSAQYGQSYNQPAAYPAGNYAQVPTQVTEEYKAQLQDIARNARDIWNSIHGVKDVPGSVKVYTIIYHILKRFRATFHEDPPLSMIVDGLSNNKDMRPVRNVNGLVCKACSLGMPGSISAPNKKHFSFPQLVNHFHSTHEEGVSLNGEGPVPDWTKDMVELPDNTKLASVVSAAGIDDKKLQILTEALPEIVTAPLPNIANVHRGQDRQYTEIEEQTSYLDLAPSQDNHESYYTAADSARPSDPSPITYDSGEYDPRNPRDLPVDSRLFSKPSLGNGHFRKQDVPEDGQRVYRYPRQDEESRFVSYQERPERSYVEQRPMSASSHARHVGDYGRVIVREEAPIYVDRPVRYRDPSDVEYRVRRDRPVLVYDESEPVYQARDYRMENSKAYQSNHEGFQPQPAQDALLSQDRLPPPAGASSEQNRIFEVVAQIEQQAKEARERQHARNDPAEAGSEDGEVRTELGSMQDAGHKPLAEEASNAAERFLNDFQPGDPIVEAVKNTELVERRDEIRPRWESERGSMYHAEPEHRIRGKYEEDQRIFTGSGRRLNPDIHEHSHNGHIVHDRALPPRQSRTYANEDRYVSSVPEHAIQRERSPELVDRRYKLNNVVYRDERQSSTHRTPSRYARYESVRLENDRARSRSPVYVKMGPQPGQYRERSPVAQPLHQEPAYRSRTPQPAAEGITYERAPRQEYYRVYTDEPRPREPQYAETFEYVRVVDPQGDYMIRRPVRRQPEPVYAKYEDDGYARQPVYESRAPVARSDPAVYEEEYDPRHPEPPAFSPAAPVRQVRYQ